MSSFLKQSKAVSEYGEMDEGFPLYFGRSSTGHEPHPRRHGSTHLDRPASELGAAWMMGPTTPLPAGGARSAARSWSSQSSSQDESDDHVVIDDSPFLAVGGRRMEWAVCARTRL